MDFDLSEAAARSRLKRLKIELALRKATVDYIKASIAALQYELEDATDAYYQAMMEHRRVSALFPPVSRLPHELLAEIFSMANTGFPSAPMARKSLYWALDLPVRLSHVSRRFRHIALTTASLWTNIYIFEYPLLPRTTLYLSRCHGAPLDIRVSNLWETDDASSMDRLFELLAPASRWRSLCVKDGPPIVVHHFMQRAGPAANLEILQLKMSDSDSPGRGPLEVLSPFDGCASVLTSMRLINVCTRWPSSAYASLIDLTLTVSDMSGDPLYVLRHTHNLKRLTAVGSIRSGTPPVSSVIVLDLVESVTFSSMDAGSVGFLLSSLSMPDVRNLTLQLTDMHDHHDEFSLFTPSRFPALRSLSLSGISLSDPVGFASRFPTIEKLQIDDEVNLVSGLTEIMDPCSRWHEDTLVFPKLQLLEFTSFSCRYDLVRLWLFLELRSLRKMGPHTVLLPSDADLTTPSTNKIDLEQLRTLVTIETRTTDEEDQSWDTDSEAGESVWERDNAGLYSDPESD